ncbi:MULTISPECIES: hypothetical protein, partial [unclassified Thiocapsa]
MSRPCHPYHQGQESAKTRRGAESLPRQVDALCGRWRSRSGHLLSTRICPPRTPRERPLWRGQQTGVSVRLVLLAKGKTRPRSPSWQKERPDPDP